MLLFILKKDRSVVVFEPFNDEPHYINTNYKEGQIFRYRYLSSREYWDCLHRSVAGKLKTAPLWVYAFKVPNEVKMAALLVN